MRAIYCLFLIAFLAVVGIFAYLNNRPVEITYVDQTLTTQTREVLFPAAVGATYLLGMLSGWTVVGLLRRSWRRVAESNR